ncbi:MAG: tetratricopeptide repeat protein [Roseibacillus sp.]
MRLVFVWILASLSVSADNTANLSLYAKGVFAEQNKELRTARSLYEETLAQDPNAYPLVQKVASIQSRRVKNDPSFQDIPAATATLRTFAKNNREHLASQLNYASFLRQHAPRDEIARQATLETLELAEENFPHDDIVFSFLISLYEDLERRNDSLSLLEKELSASSDDPNHWLALIPIIKTLYPADDPQYAAKLAQAMAKVAEHGLHRADIARRVSEYHRNQGRMDQALTTLEEHLELSPSSHSLRTRLGLLQLSNKDEKAGEETLLDVIAIDPDQSLAHSSLAKLYTKRNDPLRALGHRAEVLRIRGGDPTEAIQVADEYLALDMPHEARLLLEKFRFDHPESPGIHARLAIATLRDGLTQEAARLFRQAEALAEESKEDDAKEYLDTDFQIEFAHILVEANDLASAETRLRQAAQGLDLDAEPKKYARAVTALAKLWLDQGKNEAPAKALLQRATMLDPENEEAASLLK